MTLCRLTTKKHASSAFTGEGARIAGGRWNQAGTAVVYVSGSLALAALEQFVHLTKAGLHIEFVTFKVDVPDEVAIDVLEKPRLPRNWRQEPVPEETQKLGSQWVKEGRALLLQVPSVLVPSEYNFVLNPAHSDYRKMRIHGPEPFSFDPRMWK